MEYSVRYNKKLKAVDKADEVMISWKSGIENIQEFMDKHPNTRVAVTIEDHIKFKEENGYKVASAWAADGRNLVLCFRLEENKMYSEVEADVAGIPHFYDYLVSDFDEFQWMLGLEVTDIYVVENICFELDVLADLAHAEGIRLRTFCNVAQSSIKSTPAMKKFFIRPEDVAVYEEYLDVLEFFGYDNLDSLQVDVYYDIYAEDHKWFGPLKEIIMDFDSDLDSRYILPNFATRRLSCKKRCFKGGPCRICEAIESLSHTMEEKGYLFKQQHNH